jgi:hypothetical protein
MTSTPTKPRLTASLHAPTHSFSLPGTPPFILTLTLTLHAPAPIRLYTAGTFLSSATALRSGGIIFTPSKPTHPHTHAEPLPRSTRYVNRGNGPYRPWHPASFLTLTPGKEVHIAVPFGSANPPPVGDGRFDVRLWITTAGFRAGEAYVARLPAGVRVSWWRWAGARDDEVPAARVGVAAAAAFRAVLEWWRGGDGGAGGEEGDVPVLPEDEQLVIEVVGEGVTFTCFGEPVGPRD